VPGEIERITGVDNKFMKEFFEKNGLNLVIIAAGMILAWGALNARVSAVENKVEEYPSQDWFELKFEGIDKLMGDFNKKLDDHVAGRDNKI
jgi:hypothetical protein